MCVVWQDEEEDDSNDDDDDSDDEMEETALESYTTPIDDEDADQPIDEYIAFQSVMASKCGYLVALRCWISR